MPINGKRRFKELGQKVFLKNAHYTTNRTFSSEGAGWQLLNIIFLHLRFYLTRQQACRITLWVKIIKSTIILYWNNFSWILGFCSMLPVLHAIYLHQLSFISHKLSFFLTDIYFKWFILRLKHKIQTRQLV